MVVGTTILLAGVFNEELLASRRHGIGAHAAAVTLTDKRNCVNYQKYGHESSPMNGDLLTILNAGLATMKISKPDYC